MKEIWTIGALLKWTEQYFSRKGIDTPRMDAEILLAHVLKKERIYLYAYYDQPVVEAELAQYRELVRKRGERLSVAHLLGMKEFMGLTFHVTADVLVPRPDTEVLVEAALEYGKEKPDAAVLDIGTGSGAILISLLHYQKTWKGIGADISEKALEIARENAESLAVAERADFLQSDLFQAVEGDGFDILVSNPPYLTAKDMQQLEPEVEQDPKLALDGGADGLAFYRRLIAEGWQYLAPDGYMFLEIGMGQAEAVCALAEDSGRYKIKEVRKDYGHLDRVVILQRESM